MGDPTRFALALACAMPLPVGACSSAQPDAPAASIAGQPELSRDEWLAHTRRSLRRESCAPKARFRRCSDVERDECEHRMGVALKTCAGSIGPGLPARIAAGHEDAHARDQLTGCMWHHAAIELGPTHVDMLCLLSSG